MVEAGGSFRHPSPHKDRSSTAALGFAFAGGPAAWTAQLLVSYGLTSSICYPGPLPRTSVLPGTSLLSLGLLGLGLAALALALSAFAVSYGIYARARAEMQGETNELLEIGEGRSRFIALCGLITAAVFAFVIVFNMLSLYLVPPCTR